jgi:uncharacterized protein GlcG (DUF336 family)
MSADYYVKHVQASLRLADAERMIEATLAAGAAARLLPLAVAVLDAGANLVAFRRQDGAGTLRRAIAEGKAGAALGMGIGSRVIRDRLKERPAFQAAIAAASEGRFIPVPGGVLVLNAAGEAIGAVGVSGDASDKDEYAAISGVQAAGFASHPAEAVPNWAEAGL